MEKNPEKFPFQPGQQVWIRGDRTPWEFTGFDPESGDAVVKRGENMGMKVPVEKLSNTNTVPEEEGREELNFESGEKVLVTDPVTYKQVVETYIGLDPTTGLAIVTVEGGKGIKRVDRKNLGKVS